MKFKFKKLIAILLAFVCLVFASCDKKTPVEGYLTDEEVLEIVKGFSKTTDYATYSYNGSMNFLGFDEDLIPDAKEIRGKNKEFKDSLEKYDTKAASYYLRMPLHLTYENWTYSVDGNNASSTKFKIESMLLTYGETLDKVYYYTDAEGNFIIRTFGANKGLIIDEKKSGIVCHGKWNVTITYDKNGYLVSEEFATINAHKDKDEDSCYGEATYTFAK